VEETMNFLITRLRGLKRDMSGQDLLEYALLVALIALVAYGAVELTGTNVNKIFSSIAGKLGTAASAGA
jgi:Flp pilus assembly pilin Flp